LDERARERLSERDSERERERERERELYLDTSSGSGRSFTSTIATEKQWCRAAIQCGCEEKKKSSDVSICTFVLATQVN
jgi:hypothetical protein